MSAYLMDQQTIGLLAHFATESKCVEYGELYGMGFDNNTDKVVEALTRANLLSLAVRYPDSDPAPDFVGMSTAEFISECKQEARRMWSVPVIEILKSCDCFAYQSCEYDDWHKSTAHKIINAIRKECITRLPGYEEAQWGYTTDNPPPIVTPMSELKGRKPQAGEVISLFS
jgi:hypothetical protein